MRIVYMLGRGADSEQRSKKIIVLIILYYILCGVINQDKCREMIIEFGCVEIVGDFDNNFLFFEDCLREWEEEEVEKGVLLKSRVENQV